MLFDEVYDERRYRCDTVLTRLDRADTVMIVGTALQTNLASNIYLIARNENKSIIEVNKEP